MPQVIEFESLGTADLVVDAIYEAQGSSPRTRSLGSCPAAEKQFAALFTTGQTSDGNLERP
jgi:hypothetical protein